MFFKKSLKKLEKEIKPYLEEGDYRYVGMLYENNGYKKLAKKYYDIWMNKSIEKRSLENLKREKIIPSEKCHNDLAHSEILYKGLEMDLEKHYIRN